MYKKEKLNLFVSTLLFLVVVSLVIVAWVLESSKTVASSCQIYRVRSEILIDEMLFEICPDDPVLDTMIFRGDHYPINRVLDSETLILDMGFWGMDSIIVFAINEHTSAMGIYTLSERAPGMLLVP